MAHPAEDVATNGTIGVPSRWWTTSQAVCKTQPTPINRSLWMPLSAKKVTIGVNANSPIPRPPSGYAAPAPPISCRRRCLAHDGKIARPVVLWQGPMAGQLSCFSSGREGAAQNSIGRVFTPAMRVSMVTGPWAGKRQ